MWVAKLRTDQTVGSSVMKAKVVTVSGVTWTSSVVPHSFGVGTMAGSLSSGSPSGRGSGQESRLNVQSGPSKDPNQGSSWAAWGPRPLKGEDIRSCQRPKFLMWEPSQATLDHRQFSRSFVVERVTPQTAPDVGLERTV